MNTEINYLQKLCHNVAISKGWWEEDRNDGELIALMHSELSEVLEELRKMNVPTYIRNNRVGEELADCVIRILDYCGAREINLEHHIILSCN